MTAPVEHRPARLNKSKRWVPKKWDPMYDQMVVLSCAGYSGKQIGDLFGYGPQQVSNILSTDKAKLLKDSISKLIRENTDNITNRIARLEDAALKNVESALTDENLRAGSKLALADRSLAFLKGIGKLEGDKPKEQKDTHIYIGKELATKLIEGIAKANEAAVLHNGVEVRTLPSGVQNVTSAGTKRD